MIWSVSYANDTLNEYKASELKWTCNGKGRGYTDFYQCHVVNVYRDSIYEYGKGIVLRCSDYQYCKGELMVLKHLTKGDVFGKPLRVTKCYCTYQCKIKSDNKEYITCMCDHRDYCLKNYAVYPDEWDV